MPSSRSAKSRRHRRSILRPLGIVGYDAAEPAILAALATEEPLLLVSDHGAAKTLLLTRLAEALGLDARHYNASLLQFDDLAGFPIPDERGGVRYAAPPGAIWGAQAVFIDEIGRCRPEVANKLFPIIHERRIQGMPLHDLRHRWAATNPPADAEASGAIVYDGVERLDAALADRFTFVVRLPGWESFEADDRAAVVRGAGATIDPESPVLVRELVHATRALVPALETELDRTVVEYVLALVPKLAEGGVHIGGRRAAALRRAIVAVAAACLVLGRETGPAAFLSALQHAIPDVVRIEVRPQVVNGAHRHAWSVAGLAPSDPNRVLALVADPMRRAALAVQLPGLRASVRASTIASSLAALDEPRREILAWRLLPAVSRLEEIPVTTIETVTGIVAKVAAGGTRVIAWSSSAAWTTSLRQEIARLPLAADDAEYLFNALVPTRANQTRSMRGPGFGTIPAFVQEYWTFWQQATDAFRAAWPVVSAKEPQPAPDSPSEPSQEVAA